MFGFKLASAEIFLRQFKEAFCKKTLLSVNKLSLLSGLMRFAGAEVTQFFQYIFIIVDVK